ncbi:MAG: hypothetical protein MZV63_39170 [Marinilabiliales bacterium]|nr:hypothetical protein [Marinilabiliales bacterium]
MRVASDRAASVATGVVPVMFAVTSTAGTVVPPLPISIISISRASGGDGHLMNLHQRRGVSDAAAQSCGSHAAGSLYFQCRRTGPEASEQGRSKKHDASRCR